MRENLEKPDFLRGNIHLVFTACLNRKILGSRREKKPSRRGNGGGTAGGEKLPLISHTENSRSLYTGMGQYPAAVMVSSWSAVDRAAAMAGTRTSWQ